MSTRPMDRIAPVISLAGRRPKRRRGERARRFAAAFSVSVIMLGALAVLGILVSLAARHIVVSAPAAIVLAAAIALPMARRLGRPDAQLAPVRVLPVRRAEGD